MRILLIGATGQIGYSVAKALAQTMHDVRILVRDRAKYPFPENCQIFESPTLNSQAFRQALNGIDHIIYSVGLPEQYLPDPNVFERVNLDLLKVFLPEMVHTGRSALTYISTYEVFRAVDGVIRESHPVAGEYGLSPYFRAMIRAYRLVRDFSVRHDMHLVTVHPAAVYGGVNTGEGITNYLENLLHKRLWRVPFVFDGRFPVVHADSLAKAIIASLSGRGAYIVSEQMTTLKEIAMLLGQHADSFVPLSAPVKMARAGAMMLEGIARLARTRPILARVQIDFITKGIEPISERIMRELDWHPLTLDEGIAKYLEMRSAATTAGHPHTD